MQYKKLWIAFAVVVLVSFAILGGVGYKAINSGPPTPAKVVTADGSLLFTGDTIRDGQNVWQSTGGQEIGTIWGHGAYVAPDWSADYLHRQSEIVLNRWASQQGSSDYHSLNAESRAALQGRLTELTRRTPMTPPATPSCSTQIALRHLNSWRLITQMFMAMAGMRMPFLQAR